MVKPRFLMLLVALAAPGVARAQPRVGVVVVSHEGLTEEHANDITALIAKMVANQAEGSAVSGEEARALLPPGGVEVGCDENPACGRDLGKLLGTDEVLLVTLQKTKRFVLVNGQRVPRDPAREPTHVSVRLVGPKNRQVKLLAAGVSELFPKSSVLAYVEPAAPPPPPKKKVEAADSNESTADDAATDEEAAANADDEDLPKPKKKRVKAAEPPPPDNGPKPVYKKGWFIGVMAGVAAVVVAGVAVGIYFGIPPQPTGTPVTLP